MTREDARARVRKVRAAISGGAPKLTLRDSVVAALTVAAITFAASRLTDQSMHQATSARDHAHLVEQVSELKAWRTDVETILRNCNCE